MKKNVSKIKNKKVSSLSNSDTVRVKASHSTRFANNKLKEINLSSGAVSNFEIEKTRDNEHLENNFIGVFTSNHINEFVNFHKVIVKKKAKYLFMIWNAGRFETPSTLDKYH